MRKLQAKKSEYGTELANIKHSILVCKSKCQQLERDDNTTELQSLLETNISKIDNLSNELDEIEKNSYLYKEISKIFSEDGIKRKILNSILPEFNESINFYTKELRFPYNIEIDNTFNSLITSMGEEISVKSLSTGEHKRADFAVIISIIKIMKRNFPSLNLLFLDELLGNNDVEQVSIILNIIREFVNDQNMNVVIIHHGDLDVNLFDYKIASTKNGSFSEMEISEV